MKSFVWFNFHHRARIITTNCKTS